jgi:excisionase family DNA binding protein
MVEKPKLAELETISIPEAGEIIGVSRNTAYELAKTGGIPTVKFGPRIRRVPVARFRRMINDEPPKAA